MCACNGTDRTESDRKYEEWKKKVELVLKGKSA